MSRYAPVGYVISRVFARDADFAVNARLSFHLVVNSDAEDPPSSSQFFDVDPDLGAVSVASDLRRATLDRYELALAVTDGGLPPQSAQVTLTVNLVDTPWTEPHASGRQDDSNIRGTTFADVFYDHRVLLVALAAITLLLTVLLVLAVVCIKCRQVIYVEIPHSLKNRRF